MHLLKKKCDKCGHRLVIHSGEYCPKCAPIKKQTMEYYDIFRLLHRLEVNRAGGKDRVWTWLCNDNGLRGNDTYFEFYFPNRTGWPNPEDNAYGMSEALMQDFEFLEELLGLPKDDDNSVTVWCSW